MSLEQHLIGGHEVTPEEIVAAAKSSGSHSIAYTYTANVDLKAFRDATYKAVRGG